MVIKRGRFGRFIACTGYPECRNTKPITVPVGVQCPECGSDIVEKKTRRGRLFFGCSNYPNCTFAVWQRPLPIPCPACGGLVLADAKKGPTCSRCGRAVEVETVEAKVAG
jgi:DNA topoisomerase-1